jgi:hypothetical protein
MAISSSQDGLRVFRIIADSIPANSSGKRFLPVICGFYQLVADRQNSESYSRIQLAGDADSPAPLEMLRRREKKCETNHTKTTWQEASDKIPVFLEVTLIHDSSRGLNRSRLLK